MRFLSPFLLSLLIGAPLFAQPPQPPTLPGAASGAGDSGSITRQYTDLIPELIASLKDSDADVRQHAAMALATLGADALKPLTESLSDPVKEKRAAAAYALGHMGYEGRDSMPALLKTLKDEDPSVRRAASQAISRIVSDEMIEPSRTSPRYRGRSGSVLPRLTVPGTQTGPLPPLDPVPNPTTPKTDQSRKSEPPK